ncbi:MAG: glycosyltransferase [Actinomycetaceae bacterium]
MSAPSAGTMVFHAPYPVGGESTSGSGIRPVRMLQGFHDAGFDVIQVTGYAAERKAAIADLAARLKRGDRVDFAYGESSTMPTVLTETHHLPTHPFLDASLARLLGRHGVPRSQFYRDIYWRYPEYTERVHPVVAAGTRTLYHGELRAFRRLLDRVYVPSREIAGHIPHVRAEQMVPLPPGGVIHDVPRSILTSGERATAPLTLLYVGNISSYYRMHALFTAVQRVDGVRLILCTPADSWEAQRGTYPDLGDSIEVVHERGEGLNPLFARADICSIVVEPSEYRDFAAPVKLYEYIGHGKPVLATAGTLAGRTVAAESFGWEVDYDADALAGRLAHLRDAREEVEDTTERVRTGRHRHTWVARSRFVAEDLAGLDRR